MSAPAASVCTACVLAARDSLLTRCAAALRAAVYLAGRFVNGEDPQRVHCEATALFYQVQKTRASFDEISRVFGPSSGMTREQVVAMLREHRQRRKAKRQELAASASKL